MKLRGDQIEVFKSVAHVVPWTVCAVALPYHGLFVLSLYPTMDCLCSRCILPWIVCAVVVPYHGLFVLSPYYTMDCLCCHRSIPWTVCAVAVLYGCVPDDVQ